MNNQQMELITTRFPREAYQYGERSSGEIHGVVLTKPHIVDLILDLAEYKPTAKLLGTKLLEPSCGHGAFLMPAVRRLLEAFRRTDTSLDSIRTAITAFDIDPEHVEITRRAIKGILTADGFTAREASGLVNNWIIEGDYLLADLPSEFDFIVGNPPYIRIEQIAPELQQEYRKRYRSLFDRADLYVAFIEKSLFCLSSKGNLSFICADRWILNRYGAPLRAMLTEKFNVRCYIDLHQASPFDSDVIAYPSIFLFSAGTTKSVDVFKLDQGSATQCDLVKQVLAGGTRNDSKVHHVRHDTWFKADEPWTMSSPEQFATLRMLEEKFQPIEADGSTKIKIGVATGCDSVYIVDSDTPIEKNRLVPLVVRDDLDHGKILNSKKYVINTFDQAGKVLDLKMYPKLAKYLETNSEFVRKRHVAKKNPNGWFRTIDRVYPEIVKKPKLLIPDIAGSNEVTFDEGHYFPHHNLYFVVSDAWDLEVLGGLLSSRVALFFVWSYAVKMRGGYLRFQAQYLRRIRVPKPSDISPALSRQIKKAFRERDFVQLDELALSAYGLRSLSDFDFVDTRS